MGWNLKKKFKRGIKKVEEYGKKALGAQLKLYTGGKYGEKEAGQAISDVTGRTAADIAEKQAAEQQALVAKQEADIAAKQKIADDEAADRKRRLSQRQLLSGTEQGRTKAKGGGLLSSGA